MSKINSKNSIQKSYRNCFGFGFFFERTDNTCESSIKISKVLQSGMEEVVFHICCGQQRGNRSNLSQGQFRLDIRKTS